jgi:hypothetical protein
MLALESSRLPYFAQEQLALDSDMDPYGFPMQQQFPMYDPAMWIEPEYKHQQQHHHQHHLLFPNSPPSMAASHYSAASGASIASASSSAMGSPYSGAAHTFPQDSWVDTATGLMGMPGAMAPEQLDFNPMDDAAFASKFPTVGTFPLLTCIESLF